MRFVTSRIKLNMPAIRKLDRAAVVALEKTAEAIHTDLQQSQTMPFRTGNLQNDSTFVDYSHSARGHVSLVNSTPYARRLYYHPEFNFYTGENPSAGAAWFEPYLPGGSQQRFPQKAFGKLYKKEAGV